MNKKPRFLELMAQGNLTEADLPEWLRHAIHCFTEASDALEAEPTKVQAELLPALVGSDAVISAHVSRLLQERKPKQASDKLKMLKLKARAVELLLKEA